MSFEPQVRMRRRWIWWVLGVIVILALLAGLITWVQGRQNQTPPPGGQPSPSATTTPASEGRVANGCLGGPTVDAEMVLTAQDEAPVDDTGAAEFAAAIERWLGVIPVPPTEEVETVLSAVSAPDASEAVTAMPAAFNEFREENAQDNRWFSTEGGQYYVETSTADEVVVSVLLMVEDGTPTAPDENPQGSSNTYTLDRSTGTWLLADLGATREVADLYDIGTPFAGGC